MWRKQKYKGKLRQDVPLASKTWFRTGGAAQYFFEPQDEDDIKLFLQNYPADEPLYILGAGSNTLVRDKGVKGLVMQLPFKQVEISGSEIKAGSAVLAQQLSQMALEAELAGFEFMRGIPGTIGGCLAMNAGAHNSDTSEIFIKARAFDRAGNIKELNKTEMNFAYRSALSGYLFIEAVFSGVKSDKKHIEEKMQKVMAARKQAQPSGARTSGSTFKNPPNQKAWQLIEEAGCRDFSVGDAVVNEKHCNFLMNKGSARAQDIEALGEKIRAAVKQKKDVRLEWEIKRIGEKP